MRECLCYVEAPSSNENHNNNIKSNGIPSSEEKDGKFLFISNNFPSCFSDFSLFGIESSQKSSSSFGFMCSREFGASELVKAIEKFSLKYSAPNNSLAKERR